MAMLKSKWILFVGIPLLAIAILYLIGKKSVRAEVSIVANPQNVWSTLTNVAQVKDWNKVLIPIEGDLAEGSTVKYEFYQEENGKAAILGAKVKQLTVAELINQTGGVPGVLTFDHKYILERIDAGTKVTIHEEYRGIMVPFWNPDPVEKAYERLLVQLKNQLENG